MEWIDNVLRDVAELPDRNSPEDWPEAMLVTGAELRQIIVTHAPTEPQQAGPVRLTDEVIERLWYSSRGISTRFARAIENAILERNGLKRIPTAVTVAPRGYSWHGDRLQKDELGTLTRNPQAKGDSK